MDNKIYTEKRQSVKKTPLFRVKSVKIYTGQFFLHRHVCGVCDKHIGNPLHFAHRIVQVQLCTLAMRSLHMQWSLFNDNCIHSQRRQLGFQLQLCTLSKLAHYIWWPLGDNFPPTSASSAFLHCFPCLKMNTNMYFCGFQVCGPI